MNTGPGISELPYSPRAEQVIRKATKEATDRNQNFIGSEHFLMAIIRMQEGAAFEVINILNSKMFDLSTSLDMEIGRGPDQDHHQLVPSYTPRAKKVLSLATKEARKYSHKYIGTENILLAIMADEEGVPFKVLTSFGFTYEKVRNCVLEVLNGAKADQQSTQETKTNIMETFNQLRVILDIDFSKLPTVVRVVGDNLKNAALIALNERSWFNQENNAQELIHQLSLETSLWFGLNEENILRTIANIFTRLDDSTIQSLRTAFGNTSIGSIQERRIGFVLQLATGLENLTKTVVINFLPSLTPL